MIYQLGNLEEEILLLVMGLDEAYSVTVAQEYESLKRQSISIPAVHTVLKRLEEKGLATSIMGAPSPERGGRRKRIYQATKLGYKVISKLKEDRTELWRRIPQLKGAR